MSFRCVLIAFVVLMAAALPGRAEPFTYQGRLDASGDPVDGRFDFRFEYFGAVAGGIPSLSVEILDVQVSDGLFSVELPEPPTLLRRWIEISVRPHGAPVSYTVMSPRSFIAAAPVATTSLDQQWVVTPTAIYHGDGDDIVLINRTSRIGTEFFGVGADTDGYAGMYISTTGEDGRPFYGYSAGGDVDAFHHFDGATGRLRLTVRGREVMSVDGDGDVIITGALVADGVEFSAPVPRIIAVPPAAFRPDSQVSFVPHVAGGTAAAAYVNQPTNINRLVAPISLPHGSTVTDLTATITDLDNGRSLAVQLVRIPRTGSSETLAQVGTTGVEVGSFLTRTDDTVLVGRELVDNINFSYEVWASPALTGWTGNANLAIHHARVTCMVESAQ
ncbi:MAG: hypothetical protein KDA21_08300 [Phycisphaerales bacterium]|nr:hypothetical protein [Phycisphaerales bacterium]